MMSKVKCLPITPTSFLCTLSGLVDIHGAVFRTARLVAAQKEVSA